MGMLEPEPVNSTAVKIEPSKLETPAVEAQTLTLKRKRDLIDKFERMYTRLGGSQVIENPF